MSTPAMLASCTRMEKLGLERSVSLTVFPNSMRGDWRVVLWAGAAARVVRIAVAPVNDEVRSHTAREEFRGDTAAAPVLATKAISVQLILLRVRVCNELPVLDL